MLLPFEAFDNDGKSMAIYYLGLLYKRYKWRELG
jgi:hypothetical protein